MYIVTMKKDLGLLSHYEKYCIDSRVNPNDECPLCGYKMLPEILCEIKTEDNKIKYITETCPNCREVFIEKLKYDIMASKYYRLDIFPKEPKEIIFDEKIKNVSEKFVEIYNQANKAEIYVLKEIAGIGYRKALEFLIKDYLKQKLPERSQEIEEKMLGKCINELIDNDNIKKMSKGATWLGNDETHYIKKWEDKDITDLKNLINLAAQWILLEKMTEAYQIDMDL